MTPPPPPPMPPMAPMPPPAQVRVEVTPQHTPQRPVDTTVLILNAVNTVTHILIGAVVLSSFIFANAFNGSSHLTQHIYLCVTGYIILMSQAILTFSPNNGWTNSLKYPDKRMVHWVMQICGSVLAIAGSIIRFINLNEHFVSAHGILGLIAFILTVVSLIGGVLNLIIPQRMSTLLLRSLHACFGLLTLSVAFLSLCFGFDTLYRFVMGNINANLSISFTLMALIGVLLSTISNFTRKFIKR